MIDTLQLELQNWEVRDRSKLQLQPAAVSLESGEAIGEFPLWVDGGGELVEGAKAYFNDDVMNVSIQSKHRISRCFVKFSLPKVLRGDNFSGLNRAEAGSALDSVASRLEEVGVLSDMDGARLSRVDLFRNIESDEGYSSYYPLFSLLEGSRLNKRDYGTTYLWRNGVRELTVYDKIAERAIRGKGSTGLPENVLRFEARFFKHRKVLSSVGMDTVRDLRQGFDALPEVYNREWKASLFSFDVPDIERMSRDRLFAELSYYRRWCGRYWMRAYLEDVGTVALLERCGGVEVLRRTLSSLYDDRNTAKICTWRLVRRIEQAQRRRMPTVELWNRKTLADYYDEIKNKLLLKVA